MVKSKNEEAARRRRGGEIRIGGGQRLAVLSIALGLAVSLTSCIASPQSAFIDLVNDSPADGAILDLHSFVDWDEAQINCSDKRSVVDDNGEVYLGELTLFSAGDVVFHYRPDLNDRIAFCPELEGQRVRLFYPEGDISIMRSDFTAVPLDYDEAWTFLSPRLD